MKEKFPSKKLPKNINLKTSTANLFLNIIILLLGAVIIFMGYSLIAKFQNLAGTKNNKEDKITASAIVQVEVLNGCGVAGIADKFTDYLRKKSFDVVQMGNYISFDMDKSIVIDRTGNKANAQKVADAIGIENKNIIQQINDDYFLDVSIIIGKDFNQLKPTN